MLEEQLKELALIVKNDDLRKYAGNAFWNLIQAVISKDPVSGTLAGKDVKQIVFHMPTVIFWNKIKRFLQGTYKDYEEQVKMASQFNNDNEKYAEFVKKQIIRDKDFLFGFGCSVECMHSNYHVPFDTFLNVTVTSLRLS